MNLALIYRRGAATARKLAATAAAAATTLMLCSAPAQAAAVITSIQHVIDADTTDSDRSRLAVFTPSPFAAAVSSQSPSGSAATASLDTVAGASGFSGSGRSELRLGAGVSGDALAFMEVFFTLDSSADYDGLITTASGGNAPSTIQFSLNLLAAVGADTLLLAADETVPELAFGGTLLAGNYLLRLRTKTDSADPGEAGFGSFDLRFDLRDTGLPPAAVPEPQSLALALVGLMAAGATSRRCLSAVAGCDKQPLLRVP